MRRILSFIAYAFVPTVINAVQISVDESASSNPVFDGYVSYSIEFSSFPEFAGNNSRPNTFSENLLGNLGKIIGTKPYIRVGGNTQDYALYNASLPYGLNGTIDPKRSSDYPTTIFIGPSFFESYNTFKNTKFIHGFNLGLGGNRTSGWQTLLDTVPLACKALGGGKLFAWTYGNEPDLFSTSAQGPVRPPSWNEAEFVDQWLNGTRKIQELLEKNCPDLAKNGTYEYIAPSFAGVGNKLKAPKAWGEGLNEDKNIKLFATHNYISGATSPGVTLQGTLMNHSMTKASVDAHIVEYDKLRRSSLARPTRYTTKADRGSQTPFGAALWGVDFNLYSASVGFKRVHMHMGTNYRYASWQPIATTKATIGTKAPYYGNIAVASFLAPPLPSSPAYSSSSSQATVKHLPIPSTPFLSAYAAYHSTTLSRLIFLNMNSYNTTASGEGLVPLPPTSLVPRPSVTFNFTLPAAYFKGKKEVVVKRLMANGSDAITGITWDAWSYNWELDEGKPVRLANVTRRSESERAWVGEGVSDGGKVGLGVVVEAGSVALVEFV
ncbi:unnamed protein product [Sordaria macrospora k-hell]|uniref:WGS project CABT00000000 data, contig 2.1 n=1 Tax=Sordaria macrospora (strain ATCC MYA-333 / DSM 997 / K(L3346) / K-hell) TaxID=771870 RepID=F7VKH0_SORMK|nr:uncharacterized protein SMAC_00213 [Sordaria macrospora k-hell]CCC05997.1 unnamed protein product [Sordaria macrospora k-hell]